VIVLRSLVFTLFLYLSIALVGLLLVPTLFMSRRTSMRAIKVWARLVVWAVRAICGVRVEVRGLQHRPAGAALVAAKHQGMLDVIAPFTFLDDPCFVMKKELMALPIFGWHAWKSGMIPVDRAKAAVALKKMVADVRDRLNETRQILIFPEGTRTEPGAAGDYKPGVAALYRELDTPCALIATNSGVCWPAHGFIRRPGTVVFEFLEPVPAGLKRAQFMAEMHARIEAASLALLSPLPQGEGGVRAAGVGG